MQGLEKIIQRDFFPDVTKLQAQKDYLEAEENGDLEKMREIAIKYGSASNRSTPRVNMPCKYRIYSNKWLYTSVIYWTTIFSLVLGKAPL